MTGFADRHLHAEAESAAWDEAQREQPRFATTFCSQCGQDFGPGDHGFSHCRNHSQEFLAMAGHNASLHSVLSELAALVRGECPALLDETRGGNSRLDMEIDAALTPNA